MNGPEMLKQHEGVLTTAVGAAYVGDHVIFRGHDLHKDLHDLPWHELCALGITGRRLDPRWLNIVQFAITTTSYPDARIWNNRVVALTGTTRSTSTLAFSAGQAVSEATIYGRQNEYRGLSFFLTIGKLLDSGLTLQQSLDEYQRTQGRFPGYGRPLATEDERIPPTMTRMAQQGVSGRYTDLAHEIDALLVATGKPLKLNMGGFVSAVGADAGFTPSEFIMFLYHAFLGGMHPCYVEAIQKPIGALFPVQCDNIKYEGVTPRKWE